jgi:hypothetical protein
MAPLLSTMEMTLVRNDSTRDLNFFQYLFDGVDAPTLRSVSLSIFEGDIDRNIDLKIVISTPQSNLIEDAMTSRSTGQPFHPVLGLQSASSVDVWLEIYAELTADYPSELAYEDAFLLLWRADAGSDFVKLLQSINLLTVCFPGHSLSDGGAVNAREFAKDLQSVIAAKKQAGGLLQQVVVVDHDGTVDWEALILDE